MQSKTLIAGLLSGAAIAAAGSAGASSHREAPFITEMPKVDGTDFYMFRSYEEGRDDMVTLIANYHPLQDSYGGPNYFSMDPNALYEIHIDNNGDAQEDLSFQFRFDTQINNAAIDTGAENPVTIPLINSVPDGIGPDAGRLEGVNRVESYQVTLQQGDRRSSADPMALTNLGNAAGQGNGTTSFRKPIDFIGEKSFNGDYESYAQNHVYGIDLGTCGEGRVFVGQRQEGFVINLGEVFDLINTNPLGPRDGESNIVGDKNVTSIAMEVPTSCLTDGDPVVGAWTTASVRQARVMNPFPDMPSGSDGESGAPAVEGGPWVQVSRLGNPLVNEVVIGLDKKDRFNHSEPVDDPQFLDFVTHPVLPVVASSLFGTAVPETPRNDLVQVFLTGVPGLNQPQAIADGEGAPGEILRLNTAVAPVAPSDQSDMGVLACDLAGFPNGRRPYDDVTDIALTAALGSITAGNPNGLQFCDTGAEGGPAVVNAGAIVTDGARALGPTAGTSNGSDTAGGVTYLDRFPYLNTPLPGSPAN
ncbi:DUF4331 domain-containing protein [Algiphilus aromaticivorans]|jgi:hypothetical protein|uniref:DUF4331 domain-containing protein n=1 Tax=Algiphilus aromaticivorans TaxID=382454 RepID=UPI0005C1E703|nr:DUF4331 domain-containing protein [Algiphilus aromaticivorans]